MKFNISKIPEIYDTIRHDLSKNSFVFSNIDFDVEKFRQTSKLLAYFVVPNEYGMTDEQKIKTAQQIASPLLQKIVTDLMFWKDMNYEEQFWKYKNEYDVDYWKHIRTRLYFTSASHLYSVLHLITLGRNREILSASIPENAEKARKYIYMSYLSHIEFRLYENLQAEQNDPNRFRVELSISPDFSKNSPIEEASLGGAGFTIDQIQKFLLGVIKISKPSDLLEKLESSEPPNIIFES